MKEFLQEIRRFMTHTFIAGAILVATGFAPEQWVEKAADSIGIPRNFLNLGPIGIDIRVILVLAGMAVVIVSVARNLRRQGEMNRETGYTEYNGSIPVRDTGEISTFYPVSFSHSPNLNIDLHIELNITVDRIL